MAAKNKWYVVWAGHRPGIYDSWAECQLQIDKYPGAKYKSFATAALAQAAWEEGYEQGHRLGRVQRLATPPTGGTRHSSSISPPPTNLLLGEEVSPLGFLNHTIAVDAACSVNPGPVEYRGVYTYSHGQLFHVSLPWGTNNIGEYLAIVHALALMEQGQLPPFPIYSDSQVALKWVAERCARSRLDNKNPLSADAMKLIERANRWLQTHPFRVPLLKWDTLSWGEIPADFGRK